MKRIADGIYQRSEGSYWLRIYLGRDGQGKKIYHQETVRCSVAEAKARRDEIKHQHNTGAYLKPSKITVGEYLEQWMADWVSSLRPTTQGIYRYAVDHAKPMIGAIQLQQLTPLHLQKLYNTLQNKLSPTSVNTVHRALRSAFATAVAMGLLAKNPALTDRRRGGLTPPPPKKRSGDAWEREESIKFLASISNHRLFAMYALAAVSGLRLGELLGLRWQDLDLEKGLLQVRQIYVRVRGKYYMQSAPKSEESEKPLTLSQEIVAILLKHREQQEQEKATCAELGIPYEDHDLVFCQARNPGRPINPAQVSHRDFSRLCKKAGVRRIRFHDQRHTYATLLFDKKLSLKAIQERMRHSTATTTLTTYAHLSRAAEKEAATATDDLLPKNVPNEQRI